MSHGMLECGSRCPLWYCLKVEPRKELLVLQHLWRQGFLSFFPRYVDRTRTAIVRMMFPGYGFVQFDPDNDQWRPIASSYGVTRLFSSTPEHPTPIRDERLPRLLELCGTDQIWDEQVSPKLPRKRLEGQRLRITHDGAFRMCQGIHLKTEQERITLLLTLFGQQVPVEVSVYDVEPV